MDVVDTVTKQQAEWDKKSKEDALQGPLDDIINEGKLKLEGLTAPAFEYLKRMHSGFNKIGEAWKEKPVGEPMSDERKKMLEQIDPREREQMNQILDELDKKPAVQKDK
jgi:hypothetical protein